MGLKWDFRTVIYVAYTDMRISDRFQFFNTRHWANVQYTTLAFVLLKHTVRYGNFSYGNLRIKSICPSYAAGNIPRDVEI